MLAAAGLFASPTEDSARQAHTSAALTELHTHVGVLPVDAPCRLSPDRARATSLRGSKGTTRRPGIGNLPPVGVCFHLGFCFDLGLSNRGLSPGGFPRWGRGCSDQAWAPVMSFPGNDPPWGP